MFGAERNIGLLSHFLRKKRNNLHEFANQTEASSELVAVDAANTWGWGEHRGE